MPKYHAVIELKIDQFEADNPEQAEQALETYLDELAKTGGNLTWNECDFRLVWASGSPLRNQEGA